MIFFAKLDALSDTVTSRRVRDSSTSVMSYSAISNCGGSASRASIHRAARATPSGRQREELQLFEDELDKYSQQFKQFEKVRKLAFVEEDFTTENGLLTPSLKLKRRVAVERFENELTGLYG